MNRLQRALRRPADERGFTLIELAVAIGVFGVVLISLSLLFESAFGTANEVRFQQRAKTLAQEKLEEVRALPFYVSQKTDPDDVDILDRYFPGTANGPTPTGAAGTYDASAGVWSYTSAESITESGVGSFTRDTMVQFVLVDSAGTITVTPPIAGYDSNDQDADGPAASTVHVTVTLSWTVRGQAKSFSLDTIITRTGQEEQKVEAAGDVTGAQVSGLTFQDGDLGGVAADVFGVVGNATVAFREVADSTSQASAAAVEVIERDPNTNTPLQPAQATDGRAAATAPNATTGTVQVDSASLAAGSLSSLNPPVAAIASWGAEANAAAAEARVSFQHSLSPEGQADVRTRNFLLNARDLGEAVPIAVLDIKDVVGAVQQESLTTQSRVISTLTVTDVVLWGSRQFLFAPGYRGTVLIDRVEVESEAIAGQFSATARVDWTVTRLEVWDPEDGDYEGPWTFGFRSDCGGWVDDPALCGPARTDGKLPSENPNPVIIPDDYQGTDVSGAPALSLTLVTGATVREAESDAATGVGSATAAQKNVLSITTRDDVVGAAFLEPMVTGIGDANASVSYVAHQH